MRHAWLLAVLLLACRHETSEHGERDRKGRSNESAHQDPVATVAAPEIAAPEDTTVHRVPLGASPSIGPKDALVTIVEFGDFQCAFCKRADKTIATLRGKYGDDVRVVWKNEPMTMHKRAMPAAELAMDARDQRGDGVFWPVHDDLFASQSALEDSDLARIATARGVKQTTKHHKAIDEDHALAASLGITGTPVFFVNGREIVGAQSQEAFAKVIDERLVDAKSRVASGTARAKVYDEVMAAAQ